MPRSLPRVVLSLIVAVTTLLGLASLAPSGASAAPVLAAGPATGSAADTPSDVHPEWGSTSEKDATVRRGCHKYAYSYTITPPDGDWALETFLVGPRGKAVGSGYFVVGKDQLTGTSYWRLCRRALKGGRYTINAKLSAQNGADLVEGWLPSSTFRLRKPR